jgi:hypothetical protein
MALINLKTNLLTLKYGGDKLKGGSSNQPYITTPIPGLQSGYDPNTGQIGYSIGAEDNPPFDVLAARFPDALVRGGLLAPINAGKDVSRLTQYFFDLKSPRGLIFIANQNLLSRTAVKTEASYGAGYGGGALNEGIYLPTSTLAQVAVQGWTGTHLNKQGLNPFTPTGVNTDTGSRLLNTLLSAGGINLYSDVVKQNNLEENNQFPVLKKNIEYQSPKPVTDRFGPEIDPILPIVTYSLEGGYKNRLLNIWYNKQLGTDGSNNILSYGGGPGSALGIGKTNIQFSDQRTGDRNTNFNQPYFRGKGNRSYNESPEYIDITRKLGVSNTPIFLKQFLDPSISARGDNSILGFDIDTGNQTSNNPFGFKQAPANQTLSTFTPTNYNQLYPNTAALTQDQLNEKSTSPKFSGPFRISELPTLVKGNPFTLVKDFRKDLDIENNKTILSLSPNYLVDNIEQRVNLGDPGSRTKDRSDYTLKGLDGFTDKNNIKNALDKITASPIYLDSFKRRDSQIGGANVLGGSAGSLNDLATFYIAAYKNDTSSNAFYIHFRAFINSFSDSYNPKWNSINYVGRGNTLYNYEGFTRDVKMSFTVAAQSKQELMPMYYKLNYLASTLAPDYTNAGFMRGTLYKMTMGAYLFETPGIITSLNYTIPEQSPWEINIGNSKTESDNSVKELPHIINVDLGFTPIQDFLPRRATEKSGKGSPFISLRNGGSTESTGNENGYNHYDKYNN